MQCKVNLMGVVPRVTRFVLLYSVDLVDEKLAASAARTEEMWRQARGESATVKPQTAKEKPARIR
jgi:hypothetical protein